MRKEVHNWLDQAHDDFDAAEFNFHGEKYSVAAFLVPAGCGESAKGSINGQLPEDS